MNWNNVNIVWHENPPPIENINQIVLADCAKNLKNMKSVSDIIFHTVFIEANEVINVWGHDNDDDLHCEYVGAIDWSGEDDEE